MVGATNAWLAGYTGAGSKIAIIDTGIDTEGPLISSGKLLMICTAFRPALLHVLTIRRKFRMKKAQVP